MRCSSCERLIGTLLRDVDGVVETEVSFKLQRVAIRLRDGVLSPEIAQVNSLLKEHGYVLHPEGERPTGCDISTASAPLGKRVFQAFAALVAVGLALVVFAPLRQIVPSVSAGASVGAMVLLGLVASVSSCLASTGGFMLAASARAPSRRTTVLMHVGRLVTFILGGALLGAIGGSLPSVSGTWYGVFALFLGVGFLFVGLNLLDLAPSLARIGIALPSRLHTLGDRVAASRSAFAPLLVGAVTFILPCGFTQTAQALALASGSATQGMFLLAAFAVGTVPVLVGLTWFGSAATLRNQLFRLVIGAVLVFFAFGQIDGGLTVIGSPVTFSGLLAAMSSPVAAESSTQVANEQVVKMAVVNGTYQPKQLVAKVGIPIRWEIDGQDVAGCADTIVVPIYGIEQRLVKGLNIIRFTPTNVGTVPFSCGMGMIRGTLSVVE